MKKIALISFALIYVLAISAQSKLPKFAPSEDKVKVLLDMPLEGRKYKNGTGYSLNPKLLPEMPKKVALVSFYSFDPGMTKIQTWTTSNTEYKTIHTKTTKRNAVGSSGELALGFYLTSIDRMVERFKGFGMDLLVPEEFLDSPEKTEYYTNFVVERAKFNEWLSKLGSNSHDVIFGYPEGFNVVDVVNEPYANYTSKGGKYTTKKGDVADKQVWVMDKCGKMVESIGGKLCKALEVDAVVVVYFTIYSPKEGEVVLQNVNMHMFGPNPTPLPEGKEKKFNYFDGKFYVGTRVNTELEIWKPNKKDPSTKDLDFTGFDNVMGAMVTKLGTYLQEGIAKGK
ncbi:MAG: hypothetical protein K9H64_12535 [Bacteroidales bacterium]|nr:hypothetical protein [Bacteroidales bacterium]MCF8456872.1 hypothetical protein [Bacteroidales bacterium]